MNVSEGRDRAVLDQLATAADATLLDLHSDADHHRSVLTLGGPPALVDESVRSLTQTAIRLIDIRQHRGVHPRFGVVDVVPFVPLALTNRGIDLRADRGRSTFSDAVDRRDRFADWAGSVLGLPCFIYGPERTLPEVRRSAFDSLAPDSGPSRPHPTAGAAAVGARPVLVAYNLWLTACDADSEPSSGASHGPPRSDPSHATNSAPDRAADGTADRAERSLAIARRLAAAVRGPAVRSLGLAVTGGVQVSCNLTDPTTVGPGAVFDRVSELASGSGYRVSRAETVGLVPRVVVESEPRHRLDELDLSDGRTIESRLEERGLG